MSSKRMKLTPPRSTSGHVTINFNKRGRDALSLSEGSVPKKISLNLKDHSLPPDFEGSRWAIIEEAINAVQNGEKECYPLDKLYNSVLELVENKYSERLFNRIYGMTSTHLEKVFEALLTTITRPDVEFLTNFSHQWSAHQKRILWIRQICLPLDRNFLLHHKEYETFWNVGIDLFSSFLSQRLPLCEKITQSLLVQIRREREGAAFDFILIKRALEMLQILGLYDSLFQVPFLRETNDFFMQESEHLLLGSLSLTRYLDHIRQRLEDETRRARECFAQGAMAPLVAIIYNKSIKAHTSTILSSNDLTELFDSVGKDQLALLYKFFQKIGEIRQLSLAFNNHIKTRGVEIVQDPNRESEMIDRILDLKSRMDIILEQSFLKDDLFHYALKEAFEHAVNSKANVPAKVLAKYLDARLRAGKQSRVASEVELEEIIDRAIQIFRYINGKDVFEAFYKKDLAKRLLLNKSVSVDMERTMIQKLKIECGANFTSKLEGMFKDINLSSDIFTAFNESPQGQGVKNTYKFDVKVNVLTTTFWPPYSTPALKLPEPLLVCQDVFTKFYSDRYAGRRLIWQHGLSHCLMKALFPKGRKEIAVSLLQTAVLYAFNSSDQHSFSSLLDITGIDPADLKQILTSLALGKLHVLNSIAPGPVTENSEFTFNNDFACKPVRLKINQVQLAETQAEEEQTQEIVFKDRQYQVDAAIVRIMKTRKSLSHSELMQNLVAQLKFQAQPSDLKKRIESLIERDYLSRDPEDSSRYHYEA